MAAKVAESNPGFPQLNTVKDAITLITKYSIITNANDLLADGDLVLAKSSTVAPSYKTFQETVLNQILQSLPDDGIQTQITLGVNYEAVFKQLWDVFSKEHNPADYAVYNKKAPDIIVADYKFTAIIVRLSELLKRAKPIFDGYQWIASQAPLVKNLPQIYPATIPVNDLLNLVYNFPLRGNQRRKDLTGKDVVDGLPAVIFEYSPVGIDSLSRRQKFQYRGAALSDVEGLMDELPTDGATIGDDAIDAMIYFATTNSDWFQQQCQEQRPGKVIRIAAAQYYDGIERAHKDKVPYSQLAKEESAALLGAHIACIPGKFFFNPQLFGAAVLYCLKILMCFFFCVCSSLEKRKPLGHVDDRSGRKSCVHRRINK